MAAPPQASLPAAELAALRAVVEAAREVLNQHNAVAQAEAVDEHLEPAVVKLDAVRKGGG